MIKRQNSLLGLFQDPLLTIVALILLNTIWLTIPSPGKPEEHPTPAETRQEELQRQLEEHRKALEELTNQQQRMQRQRDWLLQREKNSPAPLVEVTDFDEPLTQLRVRIESLQAELARIEQELLASGPSAGSGGTPPEPENRQAQTQSLQDELTKKQAELAALKKQLEQERKTAQAAQQAKKREAAQQKKGLESELQELLNRLRNMNNQLKQEQGKTPPAEGEIGISPAQLSTKNKLLCEVVGSKVFIMVTVDELNKEAYEVIRFGQDVGVKRRSSAAGESLADIQREDSAYRKLLLKADPAKDCLLSLVHSEGITLFKEARQFAIKRKLDTGWMPHEQDMTVFSNTGRDIPVNPNQ